MTTYKKREYLLDWLKRIQGREIINIPGAVYITVINHLRDEWIDTPCIYDIAHALYATGYDEYMLHLHHIYRDITGHSLDLDPGVEGRLVKKLYSTPLILSDSED